MLKLATFLSFVVTSLAAPNNLATFYAEAVDTSDSTSASVMSCLASHGYQTIFARAYNPSGSGSFDTHVVNTINYAYNAGLGAEVYLTPVPKSSKVAYLQMDEVFHGLIAKGIVIKSIWIQVVSPKSWSSTVNTNILFIQRIVARAKQYNVAVRIYTSSYDWTSITGGWTGVGNDVPVWYYNVYGGGVSGESMPNFNDFVSFGSWALPVMKQFAQTETICKITVNRNTYLASSSAKASTSGAQPVVGALEF